MSKREYLMFATTEAQCSAENTKQLIKSSDAACFPFILFLSSLQLKQSSTIHLSDSVTTRISIRAGHSMFP